MAEDKDRNLPNPPADEQPPASGAPGPAPADATTPPAPDAASDDEAMARRLERLGGEPAPAISPEEFARLQQAGQIHIDSRGRVRTTRREETEAGMSLRKRRAWYAPPGCTGRTVEVHDRSRFPTLD
ncbi:MAG: hypothetical protein HPY64_12130 [Anaerolineae bacterium]|nr:hypothetical protein [Anaerolineae bacterium]